MDVIAVLIEITAYDPVAAAMATYRITNRNDPRATTANGLAWLPILQTSPDVGTSVFNGAFTGAGQLELGDFTVTLADGLGDQLARLAWNGADVKIFAGNMATGVYPRIFTAVGDSATRKGRLELSVGLNTRESLLEVNTLVQSYTGAGGLEGDIGLKGTPKPWALGWAKFCNAVCIDPVRQIYQVSAYGPVEATTNVFEGGQEISAFDGDKSLAQIQADTGPAQGKWWRCNQYGLFRLGSQPLYDVTCHVKGDTNGVVGGTMLTKRGDLISRILALCTTMPVKASSLTALNASAPQPVDEFLLDQVQVNEVLTSFMMDVGGYYTFDELGQLIFGLVRFGASSLALDGLNRQEPTVMGINAMPTSAPVWYLRLGAEQCHFVHSATNLPAIIAQQAVTLEHMTSDAWLSASEKPQVMIEWTRYYNQVDQLEAKYQALGQPADLTTVRDAAVAKRTVLNDYLGALVPSWINTSVDTPIVPTAWLTTWNEANFSAEAFAAAITGRPGAQGNPGGIGPPGASSYSYYAYANSADGTTDFTTGAPGTRAYVGFAVGASPTEPTTPASYAWTPYRGPVFGMAVRGEVDIAGDQVVKRLASAQDWDADAYSTSGFRGGAATTFRLVTGGGGEIMAGLNSDPTLDSSFTSLDYAFYRIANDLYVYESGVNVQYLLNGFMFDATRLQIEYDGLVVRYLIDGVIIRQVQTTGDRLFYFDSSIKQQGSRVMDIGFSPKGVSGGSAFTLVDVANCLSPGVNSVTKRSGGDNWNGKARTSENGPSVRVSGLLIPGSFIGLTIDPTVNQSYDTIDYAIHWSSSDTNISLWRNGVFQGYVGARALNLPPIRVTIDSANYTINYFIDGFAGPFAHTPNYFVENLFGVFALIHENTTIGGITFAVNGRTGADGNPGSPGVSPISVSAQPETFTIQTDSAGVAPSGTYPFGIGNIATQAGAPVGITSVTIISATGVTASVSGANINVTGSTGGTSAEIVYDVAAAGQTVRKRVTGTFTPSGTSATVEATMKIISPQLSWSSYQQHGNSVAINASSSGKLAPYLTGIMKIPGGPQARFQWKLQYRASGGTFIDVPGSETLSTTSQDVVEPTRTLNASANTGTIAPLTGLVGDGAYEVRVLTRMYDGLGSSQVNLTLSAKQVA